MIKKIYLDCCMCHSFHFTWTYYHYVLEELKDSFVSFFTCCETSRGRSMMNLRKGFIIFSFLVSQFPHGDQLLHCWNDR